MLRAARDAGVKRVVLTSAFGAVGYSQKADVFTEKNWTDPAAPVAAYVKSKTVAEKAAWDFVAREGGTLELAVVNPGAVFGPVLGSDPSGSVAMIQMLLGGSVPRLGKGPGWGALTGPPGSDQTGLTRPRSPVRKARSSWFIGPERHRYREGSARAAFT